MKKEFNSSPKSYYLVLGATDAISARICSRIGADYIWASSFVMSSMLGFEDKGMIDIKPYSSLLQALIKGAACPVILDFDIGGRNNSEYRFQLQLLDHFSLGGICIEDEQWPKINALQRSLVRRLVSPEEMAEKISIAKVVLNPTYLVIARTHSLIMNEPLSKLQERVDLYTKAGADVLCIHYAGYSWNFLEETLRTVRISRPLMVIASRFMVPQKLPLDLNIRFIVFPNQIYRMMLSPIFQLTKENWRDTFEKQSEMIEVEAIFDLCREIIEEKAES